MSQYEEHIKEARKRNPHKKAPKPMLITVVNESQRVTDTEVQQMVEAISHQLSDDVAPVWGMVPALGFLPAAHAASLKERGLHPEGLLCTISDEPDVPGAAGYHDEGPDGRPYIKVFTFEGASALDGPNAVSVTLSHEIIELALDAAANLWATNTKVNTNYAREGCDAPEAQVYQKTLENGVKVTVSNFVYPGFFDPNVASSERLDKLGKLDTPFETPVDGYQLAQVQDTEVKQVFAHHRAKGHDIRKVCGRLHIIFGAEYPEEKKAGKIAKAARRRGGMKAGTVAVSAPKDPNRPRPSWAKTAAEAEPTPEPVPTAREVNDVPSDAKPAKARPHWATKPKEVK